MDEWLNETLVAIEQTVYGKYRVIELRPRATARRIVKRGFTTTIQAEGYIEAQYSGVVRVQPEDITEEIKRRLRPAHPLLQASMKRLQAILDQLNEMQPMAPTGTPKALENHQAWMSQFDKIQILIDEAKNYALWTVPDEIDSMLSRIKERKHALYPKREDKDDAAN